jgi:cytoskeletal protein RodZ
VRLSNAQFFKLKKNIMANRLKTKEEKQLEHYAKMNEQYKKDSLGMGWFFIIIVGALLLTALIENL